MGSGTSARVRLDVDGAIATITNDNPDKHNAFDDEMDLSSSRSSTSSRNAPTSGRSSGAEGKSFSSGRDVAADRRRDGA